MDYRYYLLYDGGRVRGEASLDQGEGWIKLPVNPYGQYGIWDGKQWIEDMEARKSDESDEALEELIEMELRIIALERVIEKTKSFE